MKLVAVRHCGGLSEPKVSIFHYGGEGRKHFHPRDNSQGNGLSTCSEAKSKGASSINGSDGTDLVMSAGIGFLGSPMRRAPDIIVSKARGAAGCWAVAVR